jgi:hypothetical protein
MSTDSMADECEQQTGEEFSRNSEVKRNGEDEEHCDIT